MSNKNPSRRQFLQNSVLGSVAGATLLAAAACNPPKSANEGGGGDDKKEEKAAGGDSCTDVSGLSDAEKKTRNDLKYVDRSTVAGKNCLNCQLYQPAKGGATCGGCKVIKGPIHPKGNCTAWAKKA